jgi:uncharacterized protein YjbJ (UPF0337 family)
VIARGGNPRALGRVAHPPPDRREQGQQESTMNHDRIAGNWKQMSGKVREQWGKLTDDDLTVVEGQRDQLIGRIQERYGVAKEKAEEQVKAWETTLSS